MSNQEQPAKSKVELRNEGDTIFISGDAELALRIVIELDSSERKRIEARRDVYLKDLNRGEELRPSGVFSVSLNGDKVVVQNKNARGDEEYREQMRKAVDTTLSLSLD